MSHPYHHGSLRSALIDAAEVILERDGIEALTLRAVAREAGVSHAAPTHHFGDLTGLLTELATIGFVRFRRHMLEAVDWQEDKDKRMLEVGRAYVGFARDNQGLFLLMFRSERLNWSSPALYTAGQAAFALLDDAGKAGAEIEYQNAVPGFEGLVRATTRWSVMHGLATLLVDGRLGPTAERVPGTDIDRLIERVLKNATC